MYIYVEHTLRRKLAVAEAVAEAALATGERSASRGDRAFFVA
jgi:hypothetical protein